MKKGKVVLGLLALGLIGVVVMSIAGCSQAQTEALKKYLEGDAETGGKVALSGTMSVEAGNFDINLNPVLVSGDAITLTAAKIRVHVGTVKSTIATAPTVEVTIPTVSAKPVDIVFILDNTGSMNSAITGAKDSIVAFASSLEAQGKDIKFSLVTFGDSPKHPTPSGTITDEGSPSYTDCSATREVLAFGTASALQTKLASVGADSGGDSAENPLDAVMYAYNNFSWRSGAQKVFIIITDVYAHQSTDSMGKTTSGGNRCTTSAEAVITALAGKAAIYSVSPAYTSSIGSGLLDCRRLADGLGEGRVTAESTTGGKWIEFVSSGFDLTTLGIDTAMAKAYTLRFSYTFAVGTYYIYVEIDTDGDGTFDSTLLIQVGVSAASASSVTGSSVSTKAFGDKVVKIIDVVEIKNPNPIPRPNQ